LTQRELAEALNVDNSYIARLENGTRNPPRKIGFYNRLRAIRTVADSDIRDLLNAEDAPPWLMKNPSRSNSIGSANGLSKQVSAGGFHIKYSAAIDPDVTDPAELEAVESLVRVQIERTLRDYLRQRVEVRKEIEEQLKSAIVASGIEQARIEEDITRHEFERRKVKADGRGS
jgi:transcriptional regulator with XRE-family HTH domain